MIKRVTPVMIRRAIQDDSLQPLPDGFPIRDDCDKVEYITFRHHVTKAAPRRNAIDSARYVPAERVPILLLHSSILHLRRRPAVELGLHGLSRSIGCVIPFRKACTAHVSATNALRLFRDDQSHP